MAFENNNESELLKGLDWQFPSPFISLWQISDTDIDHYQHTNNVSYLGRLEQLAWQHSNNIGLSFANYKALDRAMVITKHELHYHLPSHLGDKLACATWITHCDKKFRLSRQFQFIHLRSLKTVFSAKTDFVCVCLKKGSPKRMPPEFVNVYGNLADRVNVTLENHKK